MLRNPNGNVWVSWLTKGPSSPASHLQLWDGSLESSTKAVQVYDDVSSERSPSPELGFKNFLHQSTTAPDWFSFHKEALFEHVCIFSNITSCSKLCYILGEMSSFVLNLLLAIFSSCPLVLVLGGMTNSGSLLTLQDALLLKIILQQIIGMYCILIGHLWHCVCYSRESDRERKRERMVFLIILFLRPHNIKAETSFLYSTIKRT